MIKNLLQKIQTASSHRQTDPFRFAFMAGSLLLLALLPWLSQDAGITWDEWLYSLYGLRVLNNVLTFGADQTYMNFMDVYFYSALIYVVTGILYGGWISNITEFVRTGLYQNTHLIYFFNVSHAVNALFGFMAIFYAARTAKLLGTWRAACIALVIMALSPRFIGHSLNNPKDLPLAGAYMFCLYYMVRFLKHYPKTDWKTLALIAVGLSLSIGCRVGGIILVFYLFLFSGIAWLATFLRKSENMNPFRLLTSVGLVSVLGYFGGLIFWPYGQLGPIKNLLEALSTFAKFSRWNQSVLFQGKMIVASELPWYYIPHWILITVPLMTVVGLAIFILLHPRMLKKFHKLSLALLVFAFVFPVATVVIKKSTLYDGWRHLIFVYPPMCVVCALAWEHLFQALKRQWLRVGLTFLFLAMTLEPFAWMIRNHPNHVVYFNPLVGGVRGAFGQYEMDYWGNCMREASEWLGDYHLKNYPDLEMNVRADGSPLQTYPHLKNALGDLYSPYNYPKDFIYTAPYLQRLYLNDLGGPLEWDYAITTGRGWNLEELQSGKWPPQKGTLYQVTVDDTPICAVVMNLVRIHRFR